MNPLFFSLLGLLCQSNQFDETPPAFAFVSSGTRLSAFTIATIDSIRFASAPDSGEFVHDKDIEQIQGAPRIRHVVINGGPGVTDAVFGVLKTLPRLESLSLRGCTITDDGLRTLASISTLVFLELSDCPLTDSGVSHLAKLSRLKGLRIENCQVVGECFAALAKIPCLRELNVWGVKLDDRIGKHLASFKHLQRFSVRSPLLTDHLLQDMDDLESLEVVFLTGTKLSLRAIDDFRSRHRTVLLYKFW